MHLRWICASACLLAGIVQAATGGASSDATAPPAPFRAPYTPASDATVLQAVPAAADPKVREMRALRRALSANPKDPENAVRLSRAYVDFGRKIGDAHYAGYAQAVIDPWLGSKAVPVPVPVSVLVMHGVILQYQHKFDAARAELQRAVKHDPGNLQSWLTLSSIDLLQGDTAAAAHDCASIGLSEFAIVCTATVRASSGQAEQARRLLMLVQRQSASLPPSVQAWIDGLIAETSGQLSDWQTQETYLRKALAHAPGDDFLLVSYADFLLDRGRPKEVLPLLSAQSQSDTAFLRIALAQEALNSPQRARYAWIMTARFEALALRDTALYDREHSRFVLHVLHDPDTALALAQGNWKTQRAAWDARVLLEAALAA
ncbi:MAG: hypothetical protein ABJA62_11455, partial [Luteimonas sp.]